MMSFAILQSSDDVFAANGNHTIGVVKGKEDYDVECPTNYCPRQPG